jgi:DNA-binding response OmpR family regulator
MQKPRGLRLLVVGDERELAEAVVRPARADGHEPKLASDGPSALEAARAAPPDVAVIDFGLPGLDGQAVANGLRHLSAWRKPLLVALAADTDPDSVRRAREAGIDLYLVKPVPPDHLRSFLRRFQAVAQDVEAFDPMI